MHMDMECDVFMSEISEIKALGKWMHSWNLMLASRNNADNLIFST